MPQMLKVNLWDALIIYLIVACSAAAARPPPVAPVVAAKFQRWDKVRSIPDSSPGLHPSHAETVFGRVVDCQVGDGIWEYRIQATDEGRQITSWIPEYRVASMSKAINDDQIIGTRAIAAEPLKILKRQLEAKDGVLVTKEKVIKRLKARVELAAERLAEFKALESECKKLSKEIEDRKEDNAILRKASGDREVNNIAQIVSRTGPPESASKVTHQLRELFLGKIAEANYRTDEVQEVMTGLVTKINTLTAQLRAEVKFNIDTRKELRASTRMTKALKKALDDADVASGFDKDRSDFDKAILRRTFYTSRVSSYSHETILGEGEDGMSRTSLNKERQQLFIEQGVLNAFKLASAKYYREFFNDASDKKGTNIMSSTVLAEFPNGVSVSAACASSAANFVLTQPLMCLLIRYRRDQDHYGNCSARIRLRFAFLSSRFPSAWLQLLF